MLRIAGFDVNTNTGIGLLIGEEFTAFRWHPMVKRPFGMKPQEISAAHEGAIIEEWRDFARSFLIEQKLTDIAYEKPRTADYSRTKTEIDLAESAKGKMFRKVTERASSNLGMVRAVMMCATLDGLARRLNIKTHEVPHDDWCESFMGFARAPRGTTDGRAYMKQASINTCIRLGIDVGQNDNKADGVGICWWLRGHLNPYGVRVERDLFQPGAAVVA